MGMRERLWPDTLLVLGHRVFGSFTAGRSPGPYHVAAWHQAKRQWLLFKEEPTMSMHSSFGMMASTAELAALGFSIAADPMDTHTPVYIILAEGSEDRFVEVPPGTDPMGMDPELGLPGIGNGPSPGGC